MTNLEAMLSQLAAGDSKIKDALFAGLSLSGLGSSTASPTDGFFSFGSLGRVHDQLSPDVANLMARSQSDVISPDQVDAMRRMKGNLGGFSPQEINVFEDRANQQVSQGLQGDLRQLGSSLRLGGTPITGGYQGTAAMPLLRAAADSRMNAARDITLANIDEKRRALSEFGNFGNALAQERFARLQNGQDFTMAARNDLFNRQAFNLGQLGREKSGQLGLIFNSGAFGAAQQARRDAAKAAEKAASVSFAAPGGFGFGGGFQSAPSGGGGNGFVQPVDPGPPNVWGKT